MHSNVFNNKDRIQMYLTFSSTNENDRHMAYREEIELLDIPFDQLDTPWRQSACLAQQKHRSRSGHRQEKVASSHRRWRNYTGTGENRSSTRGLFLPRVVHRSTDAVAKNNIATTSDRRLSFSSCIVNSSCVKYFFLANNLSRSVRTRELCMQTNTRHRCCCRERGRD